MVRFLLAEYLPDLDEAMGELSTRDRQFSMRLLEGVDRLLVDSSLGETERSTVLEASRKRRR